MLQRDTKNDHLAGPKRVLKRFVEVEEVKGRGRGEEGVMLSEVVQHSTAVIRDEGVVEDGALEWEM